jgi:hypothetical protein
MVIACILSALVAGGITRVWYEHFVLPALVKAAVERGAKVNLPPSMRRRIARLERNIFRRPSA